MSSSSENDDDMNFINGIRAPEERLFKERPNFLETLAENEFHQRFRVTKQTFRFLLDQIRDRISPATAR